MRINLLFIGLLTAAMSTAAPGTSQTVTYSAKEASLRDVFSAIEKQTGFVIFYNEVLIAKTSPVTISATQMPFTEFLNLCLKQQPLDYIIRDKTVVITEKQKKDLSIFRQMVPGVITGTVRGPDNTPLQGVTVTLKGSGHVVATDSKGFFSMTLTGSGKTLVFSFIGMKQVEIDITGKTTVNITMEETNAKVEEVVVVGYGSTKLKDLTGSVSHVSSAQLEGNPPHADIAAMIQGKAAGVNVMINNGSPGAAVMMQIRGTTSLTGNNQPLWVIDGVPQYNVNGSDIATILYDFNVNDIEAIDILKDASSTAIYGSRAANGVVLVTTKSGARLKKPQIDLSFVHGIQVQSDQFRMLNTDEFKQVITEASRNYFETMGTIPTTGALSTVLDATKVVSGMELDRYSTPFLPTAFFNGNTNWWNEMTHKAIEQKFDISVRGSGNASNYYLSIGLPWQDGIIDGSNRRGFTGRFNFDTRVGNSIRTGISLNGAYSRLNNKDVMIDRIWNFRPDYPMYDASGNIYDPGYNEENPITSLKNRNQVSRKGLNASGFVEIRPARPLLLRSNISISYNNSFTDRFSREGTVYTTHQGQANISESEASNWVWENTATYTKSFKKRHDLVAMGGFVLEKGQTSTYAAGAQNFPDQDLMTNLSSGSVPLTPTSTYTSSALVSGLSRINYKYNNKYLATFTFRADGSSRFGPDKRWGYFPSGAVAWVASGEPFMQPLLKTINYLKLRIAYGKSGSQVLGNNDWRTLYSAAQFEGQPGMAPSQLGNSDLQWEQTITKGAGIDFSFLNEKIDGSIDVYDKETRDIIYNKFIPASSGFSTAVKQNIANIQNRGIEFSINYTALKKRNWTIAFNFNIAHNYAKVLKINGIDSSISLYAGSALALRLLEGGPVAEWYGYKWSGRYYQSMEEYNMLSSLNPTTGAKVWYQNGTATIRPGDLRFEDINGDGIVNAQDQVSLGNAQPKVFGGFGTTVSWKGISLQANFSYSLGATRYWYTNTANWYGLGLFLKNYPEYVLDTWSPQNRAAAWPRMSFGQGSSNTFTDFWLSKADYLKLNLIRINYRIPNSISQKARLSNVDISVSANSLFTLTNYRGITPEGNFSTSIQGSTGIGADFGTYPAMRSFNVAFRCSIL